MTRGAVLARRASDRKQAFVIEGREGSLFKVARSIVGVSRKKEVVFCPHEIPDASAEVRRRLLRARLHSDNNGMLPQ